jgi:hypothetical protein
MRNVIILCLSCLLLMAICPPAFAQLPTNDDPTRQIRFDLPSEADAARERLVRFIWEDGLPATVPSVTKNVAIPALSIGLDPANIASVDELDSDVSGWGFHACSYILHPKNRANTHRPIIVHQGHGRNLELGIGSLANHLLRHGFTVVVMNLPLYGWNTDDTANIPGRGAIKFRNHNSMVFDTARNSDGALFRMFLEPIVQNVNYLTSLPNVESVSMIGLSGGGWATSMAAAIDNRLKLTIPIAGSSPLYQRNADPMAIGDAEQIYEPMYNENIQPDGSGGGIATWLEIYALGGFGEGRHQVQVSNEFDSCCFAGTFADSYKKIVGSKVKDLGGGKWEHVLDSSHRAHQISNHVVDAVINPILGISDVVAAPSGLPIRDEFDDRTNGTPLGWSVDPDFGSGATAKEISGKVLISGTGRASLIRNVPFNPQSDRPITISLNVDDVPSHHGVGIFLTDEIGSRPHVLGVRFDKDTSEVSLHAEDGNQSEKRNNCLALGKLEDYQGGPMSLSLRCGVSGISVHVTFGNDEHFSSEMIPWSSTSSKLEIGKLGDRAYLFIQAFNANDQPVKDFKIESAQVELN